MLKLRLNFNLSPNMLMNVILVKKVCKPILWVWAIRNQSLWALLFLPMVQRSREIEAIPVITRLLHSLGSHVLWRTHVRGEINIFNLVLKNTFRFITLIWFWYIFLDFQFSIGFEKQLFKFFLRINLLGLHSLELQSWQHY